MHAIIKRIDAITIRADRCSSLNVRLAETFDISENYARLIIKGEKMITAGLLTRASLKNGYSIHWLVTGEGPVHSKDFQHLLVSVNVESDDQVLDGLIKSPVTSAICRDDNQWLYGTLH